MFALFLPCLCPASRGDFAAWQLQVQHRAIPGEVSPGAEATEATKSLRNRYG